MNAETIYAAFAAWIETVRFNGAAFWLGRPRVMAEMSELHPRARRL